MIENIRLQDSSMIRFYKISKNFLLASLNTHKFSYVVFWRLEPLNYLVKSPYNLSKVLILPGSSFLYPFNVKGNALHLYNDVKPCTRVISLNYSMCIIWEAKVLWNYSVHDFSWKWGLSPIIILQLWVLPRPCISSMICATLYTSIPSFLEWPRFYIAIYLLLSSISNKQCLSSLCSIFSSFHISVPMFKLFWMGSSILGDISTTFHSFFYAYLLWFDSDTSTPSSGLFLRPSLPFLYFL